MKRVPYLDLANLEEDKRIDMIGHRAIDHKEVVGFFVDDEQKAERYIRKLQEKFPGITVLDKQESVAGTVLVRVGPGGGNA